MVKRMKQRSILFKNNFDLKRSKKPLIVQRANIGKLLFERRKEAAYILRAIVKVCHLQGSADGLNGNCIG
jgi:hypothetical protein